MSAEGLDIERLNTVILATPMRNIVQSIGRIMRKILTLTDIKPLIVDLCDKLSVFTYQGYARCKLYKKNGYLIKGFMFDNKYQVSQQSYFSASEKILKSDNVSIE